MTYLTRKLRVQAFKMMFRTHTSIIVLPVMMIMTLRGVASNESVSNEDQAAFIDKEPRVERSVTHDQNNCETWAPWVNDNHPTSSNQEDEEVISPQTLSDFCPVGQITDFECKDNNGEPFKQNITDPSGILIISCYYVGVTCKLLFPIRRCLDFSIRYFCTCNLPLTSTTNSGISQTKAITSTNSFVTFPVGVSLKSTDGSVPSQKVSTHSGIGNTTLDIGSFSLPWWGFVFFVTGLMFIINTCISACLYRRGAQRLKKTHHQKIHPLKSVRCSVY